MPYGLPGTVLATQSVSDVPEILHAVSELE